MVTCKDGRKHVLVKGYYRKDGEKVTPYERNCPSIKSDVNDCCCCVCGEEIVDTNFRKVEIKGNIKTICNECVDTIHGLM